MSSIVQADLNLEHFVSEELELSLGNGRENPILSSGWSKASLAMLFAENVVRSWCIRSRDCSRRFRVDPERTLKQPKWIRFLALMKSFGTELESCTAGECSGDRRVPSQPTVESS